MWNHRLLTPLGPLPHYLNTTILNDISGASGTAVHNDAWAACWFLHMNLCIPWVIAMPFKSTIIYINNHYFLTVAPALHPVSEMRNRSCLNLPNRFTYPVFKSDCNQQKLWRVKTISILKFGFFCLKANQLRFLHAKFQHLSSNSLASTSFWKIPKLSPNIAILI